MHAKAPKTTDMVAALVRLSADLANRGEVVDFPGGELLPEFFMACAQAIESANVAHMAIAKEIRDACHGRMPTADAETKKLLREFLRIAGVAETRWNRMTQTGKK